MIEELNQQLLKSVDHLRAEFATLQIGRANATLVEEIFIDCYGSQMPLKASANISCPDVKTIRIEPWDKTLIGEIEKAIRDSSLDINPQNMGDYIILPIPPMTEERRKEIVKIVHDMTEKARISVRNARHETLKKLKTQKDNKEISEDEHKSQEEEVQKKVDETNKQIDELSSNKEKEIMSV